MAQAGSAWRGRERLRGKVLVEIEKSTLKTVAVANMIVVTLLLLLFLLAFPNGDPENPDHWQHMYMDGFWLFLCWQVYLVRRWACFIVAFIGVGLTIEFPGLFWLFLPTSLLSGLAVFQKPLWVKDKSD